MLVPLKGEQGKKRVYCNEQWVSQYIWSYKDDYNGMVTKLFWACITKMCLFINNVLVWQYNLLEGYRGARKQSLLETWVLQNTIGHNACECGNDLKSLIKSVKSRRKKKPYTQINAEIISIVYSRFSYMGKMKENFWNFIVKLARLISLFLLEFYFLFCF